MRFLGVLALILAVAGGGHYGYPHQTLYRLDQALYDGDKETLVVPDDFFAGTKHDWVAK